MDKNKFIKVITGNLPIKIRKDGKKIILWDDCIGHEVKVEYLDNIELLKIIKYNKNTQTLTFEYNNELFDSSKGNFVNGNIGKIFNLRTSKFRVEIGTVYKDNNRDIIITNREYRKKEKIDKKGRKSINNEKWYKYTCNKCGWNEGWIIESALIGIEIGCPICAGQKLAQGINDIPTVAPWMVKYFQGGYDEAKLYTKSGGGNSNNPKGLINPICPDCGKIRHAKVYINNIYKYNSIACPKCGDGISYPNKFTFNMLEQLKIEFIGEYSPDWIKPKAYDFYIPSINKIIEMDGGLGHGKIVYSKSNKTSEETLEVDIHKDKIAKNNGIEVIRINCDYDKIETRFEFIKQNILGNLAKLLDLSYINWLKVEEFALSNRVKEACEYWNNGVNSTNEIAKVMKLNYNTICRYLKLGAELKYCDYTIEKAIEHKNEIFKINNLKKYKSTINIETGYICESSSEFSRKSELILGIKLTQAEISRVCRGERKHTHNFHFKYVSDLTPEEIVQIQENAKLNKII